VQRAPRHRIDGADQALAGPRVAGAAVAVAALRDSQEADVVAAVADLRAGLAAAERLEKAARKAFEPRLRNVVPPVLRVSAHAVEERAGELDRRRVELRGHRLRRKDVRHDLRQKKAVRRASVRRTAERAYRPRKARNASRAKRVPAVENHRLPARRRHKEVADPADVMGKRVLAHRSDALNSPNVPTSNPIGEI
jgi:hypothetical protein